MEKQNDDLSYKSAGVDTEKAADTIGMIKNSIYGTFSKNVLNDLVSFAGLFELDLKEIENPVLVSSTDGVGTKILIAKKMGNFHTIGQDLVAMCANDILCCGAKPLFFLDYIACGKLDPGKIKNVVDSISEACKLAGCSLIGGETAEMPGVYKVDDIDLAGFIVGIVDRKKIINKSNVKKDDRIIGIGSSGPHSNGYSLIRKIIDCKNLDLNKDYRIGDESKSLGDILLTPTTIYYDFLDSIFGKINIHAIANITGGGFYENIARVLPEGLKANIDSKSFTVSPIFDFLQENGNIRTDEMFKVFNMGIGMVLVINEKDKSIVADAAKEKRVAFFDIGKIKEGNGEVEIF